MTAFCVKSGKVSHDSAHKAIRSLHKVNGGEVYRCPSCSKWHITRAQAEHNRGCMVKRRIKQLREQDYLYG